MSFEELSLLGLQGFRLDTRAKTFAIQKVKAEQVLAGQELADQRPFPRPTLVQPILCLRALAGAT